MYVYTGLMSHLVTDTCMIHVSALSDDYSEVQRRACIQDSVETEHITDVFNIQYRGGNLCVSQQSITIMGPTTAIMR